MEWRGIFFLHPSVQENTLEKRELFCQENSRNCIKIAKKPANFAGFCSWYLNTTGNMEPLKGNDTRMVQWFIAPTICIAHRVALRDKVRWFVQCNLGNSGGDVSCPNVTASDCSRMCGEVHLIFCRTSTHDPLWC